MNLAFMEHLRKNFNTWKSNNLRWNWLNLKKKTKKRCHQFGSKKWHDVLLPYLSHPLKGSKRPRQNLIFGAHRRAPKSGLWYLPFHEAEGFRQSGLSGNYNYSLYCPQTTTTVAFPLKTTDSIFNNERTKTRTIANAHLPSRFRMWNIFWEFLNVILSYSELTIFRQ